jgi:hypothetical protein
LTLNILTLCQKNIYFSGFVTRVWVFGRESIVAFINTKIG